MRPPAFHPFLLCGPCVHPLSATLCIPTLCAAAMRRRCSSRLRLRSRVFIVLPWRAARRHIRAKATAPPRGAREANGRPNWRHPCSRGKKRGAAQSSRCSKGTPAPSLFFWRDRPAVHRMHSDRWLTRPHAPMAALMPPLHSASECPHVAAEARLAIDASPPSKTVRSARDPRPKRIRKIAPAAVRRRRRWRLIHGRGELPKFWR